MLSKNNEIDTHHDVNTVKVGYFVKLFQYVMRMSFEITHQFHLLFLYKYLICFEQVEIRSTLRDLLKSKVIHKLVSLFAWKMIPFTLDTYL